MMEKNNISNKSILSFLAQYENLLENMVKTLGGLKYYLEEDNIDKYREAYKDGEFSEVYDLVNKNRKTFIDYYNIECYKEIKKMNSQERYELMVISCSIEALWNKARNLLNEVEDLANKYVVSKSKTYVPGKFNFSRN